MRILFLSMHYRPEPCDTRTSVLAQEMAKRGHQCTALTSFPNYPFGKVYTGYKQRLWNRTQIEGVDVVRVPMVPDHSRSAKRRALSYLSFGFSSALLGAFLTKKPDLIWIHHPPPTTGLAGCIIAKLKRVPYVYEIHDLWPETLMSTGMVKESWVTRAIASVCRFLERGASAIVVTSPGMKSHLVAQGVDASKVHVVPQWVDEVALAPRAKDIAFAESKGLAGKFNVVFAGNIGAAQGLDTLVEAAELLKEDDRIQFVLIGDGVEKQRLVESVESKSLSNVRFVDQVPREALSSYFAHADALLLLLKQDPLFRITIPSKTQTYLFAGRPILCGVEGDAAEVVKASRAGICFPPNAPEALALAVINLLAMSPEERDQMGAAGRRAYEGHFSVTNAVEEYQAIFRSILGIEGEQEVEERLAA